MAMEMLIYIGLTLAVGFIVYFLISGINGIREAKAEGFFGISIKGGKNDLQSVVDFKLTQKAFTIQRIYSKLSLLSQQTNELTCKFRDYKERSDEEYKLLLETMKLESGEKIKEFRRLQKELNIAKSDFKNAVRFARSFGYKIEKNYNLYANPVE